MVNGFDDTASLLDKAADILEGHGWLQGRYEEEGRRCAIGAIACAGPTLIRTQGKAQEALASYLIESGQIPDHYGALTKLNIISGTLLSGDLVVAWNDAPTQTAENVISTFRKAAITAGERVE